MTTGTGTPSEIPASAPNRGKAPLGWPRVGDDVVKRVLRWSRQGCKSKRIVQLLAERRIFLEESTVRRIIKRAAPLVSGQEDDGDE